MGTLFLKPGKDRRIGNGHLWVFNNEIGRVEEVGDNGELVEIADNRGRPLGIGYHNQHTLIAARLLTRKRETIDVGFFRKKFMAAYEYRKRLYPDENSYRLVYSEGDLLPGLIVDKYGPYLVAQFLTLGIERLAEPILEALRNVIEPAGILLKNTSPFREIEGLGQTVHVPWGEVPDMVETSESGLRYQIDLRHGQKTGFFFDQRENRKAMAPMAAGRKVLDCFCYSGAFAISACRGGAKTVLAIDESESALDLATRNAALNGHEDRIILEKANCLDRLRDLQRAGEKFDMVILDPPAFVKSKEKLRQGMRGYKEINLTALKLLTPGGILVTCSCSYQLSKEDFLDTILRASRNAGKDLRLIELRSQAPDHPVLLSMPETEYLKCAILQVLD